MLKNILTILSFFNLYSYSQSLPVDPQSEARIEHLKKELTYNPESNKDPLMFGIQSNKKAWHRFKLTLKVGLNSSELQNLNLDYLSSFDLTDAFNNVEFFNLVKESYRLKIYLNKKIKFLMNAQVIGFNNFNKSGTYTSGIIMTI